MPETQWPEDTHMFIQTHNLRTRETVSVELPSTQSLMRLMVFVVLCFCVPLQSGEQTNTSVRNSYMFVDQSVLNFVHICFKACSRINSASLHKQPSINRNCLRKNGNSLIYFSSKEPFHDLLWSFRVFFFFLLKIEEKDIHLNNKTLVHSLSWYSPRYLAQKISWKNSMFQYWDLSEFSIKVLIRETSVRFDPSAQTLLWPLHGHRSPRSTPSPCFLTADYPH